jgi:hypothetical protein
LKIINAGEKNRVGIYLARFAEYSYSTIYTKSEKNSMDAERKYLFVNIRE